MPTYTSVNFFLSRVNLYDDLVRDLYGAVQVENVTIKPCNDDISLEKTIIWNQEKLNANFKPGPTTHYLDEYRQVRLIGTIYSECRLYIRIEYGEIFGFHIIVPDTEVLQHGYDILKSIAKSVVMQLPVDTISTGDEIEYHPATIELSDGQELVVQYFGYTKDEVVLGINYVNTLALNGGYFIEYTSGE
jgi:hypothetical protein